MNQPSKAFKTNDDQDPGARFRACLAYLIAAGLIGPSADIDRWAARLQHDRLHDASGSRRAS